MKSIHLQFFLLQPFILTVGEEQKQKVNVFAVQMRIFEVNGEGNVNFKL